MEILRLRDNDADLVMSAGTLFDRPPDRLWAENFLTRAGNHLLIAFVNDRPVGFVSGTEILHPDKGPEMLLYELGVADGFRRRGIGTALVKRLCDVARDTGCRGMWVATEVTNQAARRTYEAAGAGPGDEALVMEWVFETPPSV